MRHTIAILILVLAASAALAADGLVMVPDPVATATRVPDGAIVLDGRLDEAAWRGAPEHGDFRQWEPVRGAEPSVGTFFRVAYDDHAVYFGVRCPEPDMSRISSALSRRDDLRNSDIISIYIDPYHDRSSGYNFRCNLHGVVADAYLTSDFRRDWNWDAVWDVETHAGDDGWSAEFRIPFAAIRYRAGDDQTWGLQVYRWLHGRGEDTAWTCWERETHGFVSRFGTLVGLSGLQGARQLEITPYAVQGVTFPADPGADTEFDRNLGLDLKYGLSANTTLIATIQPDFGQVEADPAVLNLSPFETSYAEKRPFFVEGARAFEHPDFRLFYSRRIGTGEEGARIRAAAKLTGKSGGGLSFAALAAATDVAVPGRSHNPFEVGEDRAYYTVLRGGLENAEGTRRINLMQTAVLRDPDTFASTPERFRRNGYATGMDFEVALADRAYEVQGSLVASIVDPHPGYADPNPSTETKRGTAGRLNISKTGGDWRWWTGGLWEHDQLDYNDMGLLFAPDELSVHAGGGYRHDTEDSEAYIRQGNINLNLSRGWLYAGRTQTHPDDPDRVLWSYSPRIPRRAGGNINAWMQNKHHWSFHAGVWYNADGLNAYGTRTHDGIRGPLMKSKAGGGAWLGLSTDYTRDLRWNMELDFDEGTNGSWEREIDLGLTWQQGDRAHHAIHFNYETNHSDAQWLENVGNPGGGIGDVSYVFAPLDRRTWALTLRSSYLFSRDQSLELYLQPFLTVGDYAGAKELPHPGSYDFTTYEASGFDSDERDFSYAAVNVNLVYRWEYRPGSTLFVVWTHSRDRYDERADGQAFANDFDTGRLFDNRAANRVLMKFTYWLPI